MNKTKIDGQVSLLENEAQKVKRLKQAEKRKRARRILLAIGGVLVVGCLVAAAGVFLYWSRRNAPPQVLWRHEAGGTVASAPLIADGVAYFGTLGEASPTAFYAVDTATGRELWRTPTSDIVFDWLPAVVDGMVIFTSDDGYILALNAQTGAEQWRFGPEQRRDNLPQDPECRSCALKFRRPSLADGLLYVASHDEYLYALDSHTGHEQWRFHVGALVQDELIVVDGLVYAGSDDGYLYVLDAITGSLQQTMDLGAELSSLMIEADILYALVDTDLMALNRQTGQEQWRTHPPWSLRGRFADRLHMDEEHLYLMNMTQLIAVNKGDGSLVWQFARFHGSVHSEPGIGEGIVAVGDTDSYLYVFDAAAGKLIERIDMVRHDPTSEDNYTAEFVFDPAIVDNVIYFGWYDYLYAIRLPGT